MDAFRPILLKLRVLFRRRRVERELDDELRFHIEMETEANLRRGMSPDEARRAARIAFGGVERFREEARDARGLSWVDELSRDFRLAARLLRRNPIFTLVIVTTLALGIGANTAIFSVVNAVLLRPSPFPDASRLVMVWETDRNSGTTREPGSWPDFLDYRERSRTLSGLAAFMAVEATLTAKDVDPVRVSAVVATDGLLPLLGVRPLLGRTYTAEEDRPGGPNVVLLGERFWRSRYAADPGIVGRTIEVNGQAYTVIGVLPAGVDLGVNQINGRAAYHASFAGRGHIDMWAPLQADAQAYPRQTHPIFMVGRLAREASASAAQRELADIAARLEADYPENDGRGVHVERFGDVVFGPIRPTLLLLLGAVGLVLLVACANVANLFLARGTARAREVAVRTALGAGMRRIGRQFLVESLVLTLMGTAAGIALAYGGLHLLLQMAPPDIPRLETISLDGRVLAFAAGITVIVALAFGLVPTVQARRLDPGSTLKSEPGRGASASREGRRFRSALVVAEMALAVVVVVGAALLLRSLWQLQHVDPGFRTAGILKAQYQLPSSRYPRDYSVYPNWPRINGFHSELIRRVAALPGVRSVALANANPLDAGFTNSFVIEGRESEAASQPEIRTRLISPGYLRTVGLPLVAGRNFRDGDDAQAELVALLNHSAVDRYFPDGDAIGHRIRLWGAFRRIVGVVGDERFMGLSEDVPPAIYLPSAQAPAATMTLLVDATVDPLTLVPAIRQQIRALDPEIALYGVEPLSRTVSESLASRRFTTLLLGLFAALAVLLALIGVQGVLSYSVAQRRGELGIRMALGASAPQVRRAVVRDGLRLAVLGLPLGLIGALAASRLLAGLLYGVGPDDPATLAGVAGLILAATLLASWVPARRATSIDPMITLRAE